uniref:Uncharacterized protein n=1 Tax=Bionectria ochroleuca TaxID=29856 RepID=A0A0B7KFX8_BIOOC
MTLEARQMLGALHVFYCVNLGPWRVHYEISRSRRGVCFFLHRYDPDVCLLGVAIDCESSPIAASPGVCGTINHNRKITTWQTETGIPYSYSRFEKHLSFPNSSLISAKHRQILLASPLPGPRSKGANAVRECNGTRF